MRGQFIPCVPGHGQLQPLHMHGGIRFLRHLTWTHVAHLELNAVVELACGTNVVVHVTYLWQECSITLNSAHEEEFGF